MMKEIMPELGTGQRSKSVPTLEKIIMISEKELPDTSRLVQDIMRLGICENFHVY